MIYRYVERIQKTILSQMRAEAWKRFVEDYGDAEDLWEAHLKSLNLHSPIHNRTLWGLLVIRYEAGLTFVGHTLEELARYSHEEKSNRAPGEWHPERGAQKLHGHDS